MTSIPVEYTTSLGTTDARIHLTTKFIAQLGRQSLIAEAELTPKPGLVDRRGSGAHVDLSLAGMRLSALTLENYFFEMAQVSFAQSPSQRLYEQLAKIGRAAERAMLTALHGSNAHRGAIWSLGLLISATSMHSEVSTAREIAKTAQEIARFHDRAAATRTLNTHGDLVAARYGVTGARGEALKGFPHVMEVGLPTLRNKRGQGMTESNARLDALLAIMGTLNDTCLLYRGGLHALVAVKNAAMSVLDAGGTATKSGSNRLQLMDGTLLRLGVSPGGSADLLAATLFLDAAEHSRTVQPDRSEWKGTNGIP